MRHPSQNKKAVGNEHLQCYIIKMGGCGVGGRLREEKEKGLGFGLGHGRGLGFSSRNNNGLSPLGLAWIYPQS